MPNTIGSTPHCSRTWWRDIDAQLIASTCSARHIQTVIEDLCAALDTAHSALDATPPTPPQNRRSTDAWLAPLREYLRGRDQVTVDELMRHLGMDPDKSGEVMIILSLRHLREVMASLGWKQSTRHFQGDLEPQTIWLRTAAAQEAMTCD